MVNDCTFHIPRVRCYHNILCNKQDTVEAGSHKILRVRNVTQILPSAKAVTLISVI